MLVGEAFQDLSHSIGVDPMMPAVRDHCGYIYLREWSGGILAGGFEPQGKPCFQDGIPKPFEFQLLPEDWDHFRKQFHHERSILRRDLE